MHAFTPGLLALAQVLKNPSVPFQEGRSVDVAALTARGVKQYGPPVDVWAAGVLAYELVCGRCAALQGCCGSPACWVVACARGGCRQQLIFLPPLLAAAHRVAATPILLQAAV